MKRFLWMGFVLFVYVVCSGCGDTFRPIIIPNPPQFPNPAASHTVVSINDNGTLVSGTAMVIDVSGDSEASVANVGLAPVHAVQQTGSQVLVANHSVTGAAADSLTKLNFSGAVIFSTSTISLPANSAPNFVATTETSFAYVLMPNYLDPTTNVVVPSIQVVNTAANNLVATIPVGNNPDAMAETPNAQKLYVANQADNTIYGFNTADRSSRMIVNGSFNGPLWLVARSDSQRLYVLNGNGVVSTVDTSSTLGPDSVIPSSINAPGAAYMLYDGNKNRLYIPGGTQLTILDVSQSIPTVLAGGPITIPTVAPSSRGASDPCSTTSPQPLTVAAVAALPDGSRAYVGAYYEDASDNFCPQVTVIDAASNTIETYLAIPGFPAYDAFCSPAQSQRAPRFRIMMAAGGDSSRAYLSSCDGGNVNFIDTSTDTYILNVPAPIGSRLNNPPQNPVFLFAGP
ncbi:MAG: YncE family protein [Terriglobales bacterium]|jgi:DNA-binding beta-propeller fold protein YncE